MTKSTLRRVVLITLITGVVGSYQACGPAGTSANTGSSQSMKSGYGGGSAPAGNRGGTTTDNPKVSVNLMIASYTNSTVMGAELCIKDIQFATADGKKTLPSGALANVEVINGGSMMKSQSLGSGMTPQSYSTGWSYTSTWRQLVNALTGGLSGSSSSSSSSSYSSSNSWTNPTAQQGTSGSSGLGQYLEDFQNELNQWFSYVPSQSSYTAAPTGTQMDTFDVPADAYTQVLVNLEPTCAKGSLAVTTASGTISSQDPLTMRFNGNVNISASGDLKLDMQKIIDALSKAKSGAEFQSILDQTPGDLL